MEEPLVLSGDLKPLLELPQALLAKHLEGCDFDIERLVQVEARSLESVSARFQNQMLCDAMPTSASRAPSPTRRGLPCFGLGLKRQRAMGSHILTEEAQQGAHDALVRCAAAVKRMAKHQRRH